MKMDYSKVSRADLVGLIEQLRAELEQANKKIDDLRYELMGVDERW